MLIPLTFIHWSDCFIFKGYITPVVVLKLTDWELSFFLGMLEKKFFLNVQNKK